LSEESERRQGIGINNANLLAGHAYSIFGWEIGDGMNCIIPRNPWGYTEADTGTLAGGVQYH
jgi:hypothetical protein